MIIQRDEIPSFIPKKPKMIFLGTMCAINARTINGKSPEMDFFYYNDNRNHFWKILQYLFEPNLEPKRLTIDQKKKFLLKHNIGIQNLVSEIQIPNHEKLDPSDTVLFDCLKKRRITFKTIPQQDLKVFQKTPLYFTCRYKKGIHQLLESFLLQNNLKHDLIEKTWYLKTPTRCNPYKRSQEWLEEMNQHIKNF